MVLFCYTVALMAVTNAETFVFRLRTVPKNRATQHSAEIKIKFLSATPRCVTQCEIQAKNFLADSALCVIARNHLYLQISLQICNHMQKWFYPLISERSGLIDEKNLGSKISWDCPFQARRPPSHNQRRPHEQEVSIREESDLASRTQHFHKSQTKPTPWARGQLDLIDNHRKSRVQSYRSVTEVLLRAPCRDA
jgi:hypothetical protein